MAVFTHVARADLDRFLSEFELDAVQVFEGVESGAENTNYRLKTDRGDFILTLFERRTQEVDIPYYAALMAHFAQAGLPAPRPVRKRDGGCLGRLCGRPALIVTFLPGTPRLSPSPRDCFVLGETLAALHAAGKDFPLARANDLALDGWRALADRCRPLANACAPGLAGLIDDELAFLSANWPDVLPSGAIHGDLFPDNVFFQNGRISGLIDFYFACTEKFVFDIAVCLNSWAVQEGVWSEANAAALLEGYQIRRPLPDSERSNLPIVLRGAALRFLLTRLYDWLHRVDGARVVVKSPLEYRDILLMHRDAGPESLYAFN